MGTLLIPPTDGNLYVDRSHPSANAQGTPIRHYERIAPQVSTPQEMYQRRTALDPKTDTAGKPYFSTTFLNQYTEGPLYGSNKYNPKPMYH